MAEILCRSDLLRPAPPAIMAGRGRGRGRSLVSYPRTSLKCSPLRTDFRGRRLAVFNPRSRPNVFNSSVQMSLCIGKAMKWWEKGLQSNMKEVVSANNLAESLMSAGDRLVVVDFFSPGCGGCKALHPKICQIAEMNPDVMFLHVNYEEHKSMCYSLNVHVLPFFRFYRGAHGRVCSFSCTNATIKKFRDALAKHTTDRCSLGPTKGLEESELMALAANNDLSFNYTRKTVPEHAHTPVSAPADKHLAPAGSRATQVSQEKALAPAGR